MLDTAPKLAFRAPRVEDAAWAAPLLRSGGYRACEFSFTTIFMWRKYYHNQIAEWNGTIFSCSGDTEPVYLLPSGGDVREGIALLREWEHARGESLLLFGANREMKEQIESWFPGVFEWEPSPNDFDYLYHTEDLANLSGKKYHGKRNHIAAFSASYDWRYEPITDQNTGEGGRDDPGMVPRAGELRGSRPAERELRHPGGAAKPEALSLKGGLIRVGGKVVAMTMGSPINDEVFDIHVEKALPDYATAYSVINREFAAHELLGNTLD